MVDSEVERRRRRPGGGRPGDDRLQRGLRRWPPARSTRRPASGTPRGSRCAARACPIRVFKVDEYGAPPYPELVLTASRKTLEDDPELVDAVVDATTRGYGFAVAHPAEALDDLLAAVPGLDRAEQAAQLRALGPDLRPAPFDPAVLRAWAALGPRARPAVERPLDVDAAFDAQSAEQASTSCGSSRAILERGTTRSTPAASAARRVSTSTCE